MAKKQATATTAQRSIGAVPGPAPIDEDFSPLLAPPSNVAMAKLRTLVDDYNNVATHLAKYEELVERGKKRLKAIMEDEIPQVLEVECGQSLCQYPDGLKVELMVDYYANIPSQSHILKMRDAVEAQHLQERLDKAMTWLDEHAPAVVKRKFEIEFTNDPEDQKLADKFERDLAQRKRPLPVVRGATVHPQTLNALVRDLINQKFQVPRELLGVYEKKVAKITLPK